MKKQIDYVKPVSYNNYKYLEALCEKLKDKVDKRMQQGKDFVCFSNNEILEINENLNRINLQVVSHISLLEKKDMHYNQKDKEFYKQLLDETRKG